MHEQGLDIMDPQVWGALPVANRESIMGELQSQLVMSALKYSGYGELFVQRKKAGHDLSKEMFLIEHRNEKSVDAKTRAAMNAQQVWSLRLWPTKGKNPPGTSKLFSQQAKIARTNPVPAGDDLFCLICSDSKVFLTTVSLDGYLATLEAEEAAKVRAVESLQRRACSGGSSEARGGAAGGGGSGEAGGGDHL